MRHLTLTTASIALFLLAAPALAAGNNGNNGNQGNQGNRNGGNRGHNLTTPSPEAAIGLPALAAGIAAVVYIRSRRRKAT